MQKGKKRYEHKNMTTTLTQLPIVVGTRLGDTLYQGKISACVRIIIQ